MPEMTKYEPGTPSWVDLGTSDIDAASRFYNGLFGWDVSEAGDDEQTGGYRMATLNGKPVAGLGPQMDPGPPRWATYVTVEDVDVSAATAQKAGGNVIMPPMDVLDVGRMAVVQAPAGAFVSLWQPLAHAGSGLVNEPGTLTWDELTVRDKVAEAKAFYAALFGWGADTQPMGDGEYTIFNRGGQGVAGLLQMNDQWPEHVPPHWAVYFGVADADAAAAKAGELGAHVVQPPTDIPGVGRFATIADPQGAVFSVIALSGGGI